MRLKSIGVFTFLALCFVFCSQQTELKQTEEVSAPDPVVSHQGTKQTPAMIALGKRLFFDPALSKDSSISCASCHIPDYAFSDTLALSNGVDGHKTMRNSPSLVNIGLHPYFMREGGNPTLEVQVFVPLEGEDEMHLPMPLAIKRLRQDKSYKAEFKSAFGKGPDAFGITRAIAAYERTILGGSSRYDDFIDGDLTALSAEERHGYELFTSDELKCNTCHSGGMMSSFAFENNGTKEYYTDRGRARITMKPEDEGKFKVPSLRNISLTAPYMFDGSMKTLGEVIDHYAEGGSAHPNKSEKVSGFNIDPEDKRALLAFLASLDEAPIYLP